MIDRAGGPRILILDPEETSLRAMEEILRSAGFSEVRGLTDSRRALAHFREFRPDLLVLSLEMPHLDGYEVLRQVQHRVAEFEYFPVLVVSAEVSNVERDRALAHGAKDFVLKPYDRREVVLRVRNLLETRNLTRRLGERVLEQTEDVRQAHFELAARLARTVELRNQTREGYSERLGRTAAAIASELGLSESQVQLISRATPLGDIGMIAIPDSIVLKPEELTLEEWDLLKTHTTTGAKILSGSSSPLLQVAEEIALYHHENWDGTGYTPGLAGEEIPLPGRIAAVADVFDALTHDRPYAQAWPVEEAVALIEEERGRKFDPRVVDAFLRSDAWQGVRTLNGSSVN